MTSPFHMTRPLLIGIAAVYVSTVLLHYALVPIWMWGVVIGVLFWRIKVQALHKKVPKLWVMFLLTLVAMGLLKLEFQQWFAVEPMVVLLLVALSFKPLEIRYRRDVVLIVFLSYFAIACSFLFDQSVLHSILSLLAMIITTALLYQLFSGHTRIKPLLVFSAMVLLQSTILAAAMLLVLPRLNPLWSVPLHSDKAMVGVSDSMSPGDFGALIRNDALALRITFAQADTQQEQVTEQTAATTFFDRSQWYWRGLVFDRFDGRRWQRSEPVTLTAQRGVGIPANTTRLPTSAASASWEYEVLMEPTGQHWLYGIPVSMITANALPLVYTTHYETLQKQAINQRIKYTVRSTPSVLVGNPEGLSTEDYRRYTALPENSNPQTRQQALEWWQETRNPQAYIQRVLQFYRDNFTYTLTPPKLGQHTSDEFLFTSQQGFCEHFASSFSVLLRSVGIPVRVVVGYQGGEWSEDQEYISVYQRDAHAWTEVWLQGQGWVRFDPTAAVAIERIRQSVTAALPSAERSLVGNHRVVNLQWLRQIQSEWEVLDYRWQQWVLDYDTDKQQNILSRLLGDTSPLKIALLVLGVLGVTGALIALSTLRYGIKKISATKKLHLSLLNKLQRLGVSPKAGETITQCCERSAEILPNHKILLMSVNQQFETLLYSDASNTADDNIVQEKQLRKMIKKLR